MIPHWAGQLYPLLMALSLATGVWLKRKYPSEPALAPFDQFWIGLCAFVGAMLVAKLPFLLHDGVRWNPEAFIFSGRTILAGFAGGYLGVELGKWRLGIRVSTGDSFAVPVAGAIAVGRLACLAGGCCYGTPTEMPWGIIFPSVDQQPRHPMQLYEFIFHLTAAVVLHRLRRQRVLSERLIEFYFISYCIFRFFSEFLRPEPRFAGVLTGYQYLAVVLVLIFGWRFVFKTRRGKGLDAVQPGDPRL